MSFNDSNFFSSDLAIPDASIFLDDEATSPDDPTECVLYLNSPYFGGFCETSQLPTLELSLSPNASSTLVSSRTPVGLEPQQRIYWLDSFANSSTAEQLIPPLFQGERWLQDSSGTTDDAHRDPVDNLYTYLGQNDNTVEQYTEMSLQSERRPSGDSGTTDSTYGDLVDDSYEMNHPLSPASDGTVATSDSNFNRLIDAWKEVRQLPTFAPGTAIFVPQNLYQPRGETDREKYVYTANLSPPILFYLENPCELGIVLEEIMKKHSRRLRDRDDPVLEGSGRSISVRIEWPGYPSWSNQLPTRDYRKTPGPITKAKLATNLARCIRKFVGKMTTRRMEIDADPAWKIGNRHIRFEDLILIQVATSSRAL